MESLLILLDDYKNVAILAFVVSVFATPVAARLATRLGVLDVPDQMLKPHARPTPYLGGAAICLGWTAAIAAAMLVMPESIPWRHLLPILLGGVAMSLLGLADDMREVSPKLRLAVGATIILAVMATSGAGTELARPILDRLHIPLPHTAVVLLSYAGGLFIVLGACNSANLIDGLDGLCAGVTAIISLGFFLIAAHLAIHEYSRPDNAVRLVLTIALFGAILGFLPFNMNPAKIFMGDAGSILLGYTCGMMILLLSERAQLRWMLGGIMTFGLPIFDTALAIVRRWRSGRSIFEGDRSHFYDQLVDRGLSVRKVVFISYALAAFYAILGCASIWLRLRYTIPLYAIVVVLTVAVLHCTGMARPETPPDAASNSK